MRARQTQLNGYSFALRFVCPRAVAGACATLQGSSRPEASKLSSAPELIERPKHIALRKPWVHTALATSGSRA